MLRHLFRVGRRPRFDGDRRNRILGQVRMLRACPESGARGLAASSFFRGGFACQLKSAAGPTSRRSFSVGSVAGIWRQDFRRSTRAKVLILVRAKRADEGPGLVRGGHRHSGSNRSSSAPKFGCARRGRSVLLSRVTKQCRRDGPLVFSTSRRALLTPDIWFRFSGTFGPAALFIIDIAVPRDVAPEVNEIDGVFLYDIDSLQSIAEQSLALRRQQIAAGERIIAEHVSDFCAWFGRGHDGPASASPLVSAALDEATLRASQL